MGRPLGSKNKAKDAAPAGEDTKVDRSTAPKQLLALIKAKNQAVEKTASISGEIGERIGAACETGHLHRKAFSVIAAMDRMEEDRRNDFIRSLRLYLDVCEEQLWVEDAHVGDLAEQAEAAEARALGETAAHVAENVKNLAGIGQLSEEEQAFDDGTAAKPSRRVRKAAAEGADAPGNYSVQ